MTKDNELFGHPKGLFVLFFTEMWERFSYYGMRAILVLYLVTQTTDANPGLGWTTGEALALYGWYTMLVYVASIPGGWIADRLIGQKKSVLIGGLTLCVGHGILAVEEMWAFYSGLGLIIAGVGLLKPNISTMVGGLYKAGDTRRDRGFTIFYIGINIGALLATTVVAVVGQKYGFEYGFGLAGLGMLAGLFIFWSGRKKYEHVPNINITPAGHERMLFMPRYKVITVLSLFLIPLCYVLILKNSILIYLLIAIFVFVVYQLISAGAKEGKMWRDRMIALTIMMVINIIFWAAFEQAAGSLPIYTRDFTNRI